MLHTKNYIFLKLEKKKHLKELRIKKFDSKSKSLSNRSTRFRDTTILNLFFWKLQHISLKL